MIETLTSSQIDSAGWGYHTESAKPEIAPTALVLLAGESAGLQDSLTGGSTALAWLRDEISANYKALQIGELALGLWCVHRYLGRAGIVAWKSELRGADKWLRNHARYSQRAWEEYPVSYEAPTTRNRRTVVNDEYFVMPSTAMLLCYLLVVRPFTFMRPPVIARAAGTLRDTLEHGVYISPFNQRASTRANFFMIGWFTSLITSLDAARRSLALLGYLSGVAELFTARVVFTTVLLFAAVAPYLNAQAGYVMLTLLLSLSASVAANLLTRSRYW